MKICVWLCILLLPIKSQSVFGQLPPGLFFLQGISKQKKAPSQNKNDGPQKIINGNVVSIDEQLTRGLVTVSSPIGGCSGVLADSSGHWVLTAGHCLPFGQNRLPINITYGSMTFKGDRAFVMGGETDSVGNSLGRGGYDLALIHLPVAATVGGLAGKFSPNPMIRDSDVIAPGSPASYYGRGVSTIPPNSGGTWLSAQLTTSKNVWQTPYPDLIISPTNNSGQTCAPGDSGGPVYAGDKLAAVIIAGDHTCTDTSTPNNCKATITKIINCKANRIPVNLIREVMNDVWNSSASAQVFDVAEELPVLINFDPTRTELDMNLKGWAITERAANEICFDRGFLSGHMTGNQLPPKFGVACAGTGAVWRNATTNEVANSGFPFNDLNVNWAQASRAANAICTKAIGTGFVGGHWNGLAGPGVYGLVCYKAPAQFFDATSQEVAATGLPLGDLNQIGWAQAARFAMRFCEMKGFVTGFMTGNQLPGKDGVICQK